MLDDGKLDRVTRVSGYPEGRNLEAEVLHSLIISLSSELAVHIQDNAINILKLG